MNSLIFLVQILLILLQTWINPIVRIRIKTHWGWRLAVLITSALAIVVWALAMSSCQPKRKPATPVKSKPAAVDSTRLRREQKVQAAKQSLQADQNRANSAVTDYENAASEYDAVRVPMP